MKVKSCSKQNQKLQPGEETEGGFTKYYHWMTGLMPWQHTVDCCMFCFFVALGPPMVTLEWHPCIRSHPRVLNPTVVAPTGLYMALKRGA